MSKAKGAKTMFILKANAYGHGLVRIAQLLERTNVDYLGVAYLEEGLMLREAGIETPILVMGGIIGDQIPLFIKHRLTITASSVEKLQQIDLAAKSMGQQALAHLKIDTGMERIGVHYYSVISLLEASLNCTNVEIEGIYSHLANAEATNLEYSQIQVERFLQIMSFYEERNIDRPMTHIYNSGGFLQLSQHQFDMIRVGLLLYGIYPARHMRPLIEVEPAMTWKTRVVYFKVVQPSHPVSYGGTWTASSTTRIVTLPIGYGDGYMRAMSNMAQVLIRGQLREQVGNICMDQMMIDIGPEGTAYNGDEVILVGRQGNLGISVEDLAEWAGTIPYEIMTNINTRVPRVYINA